MTIPRWIKGRMVSAVVTWVLRAGVLILGALYIKRLQRQREAAEARVKRWEFEADVAKARAKTEIAKDMARAYEAERDTHQADLSRIDEKLGKLSERKRAWELAIENLSKPELENRLDDLGV